MMDSVSLGSVRCKTDLPWNASEESEMTDKQAVRIPVCSDRPPIMNMRLGRVERKPRKYGLSIKSDRGGAPFNLANLVFNANVDAVSSLGDYRHLPDLGAPATPERILAACDELRNQSSLPD